jgi:dynein heavy chain
MDERGEPTKVATAMHSKEGEVVEFVADCSCDGPVELWLQNVVDSMKLALQEEFRAAIPAYEEHKRVMWLTLFSAQNTVVVSRVYFTSEVTSAFEDLDQGAPGARRVGAVALVRRCSPLPSRRLVPAADLPNSGTAGNEDALRQVYDNQVSQLADLIDEINKDQTKLARTKLITLCTIDVHARDLMHKLIEDRVEDVQCFQWQSQLRYGMAEKTRTCQVGRPGVGSRRT